MLEVVLTLLFIVEVSQDVNDKETKKSSKISDSIIIQKMCYCNR